MITITDLAKEKGTIIFTVAFTDEDGAAAVPKTLKWSLTDNAGTVINSRDQVPVTVPAASNDIVLSGLDLQMGTEVTTYVVRKFIVEATYDSSLGNDLPVKDTAVFKIENLTKVT